MPATAAGPAAARPTVCGPGGGAVLDCWLLSTPSSAPPKPTPGSPSRPDRDTLPASRYRVHIRNYELRQTYPVTRPLMLHTAATHFYKARDDLLAFTAVPRDIARQIWSSNPQ